MKFRPGYFIRSTLYAIFLLAGFFIFSAGHASAATITSTATGGVWATGSTWVGGVAPANTDSVIIATTGAGSVTLGANATCAGLTINSGATLTAGNKALTVNGNTNITGTINITSTTGTKAFNGDVTLNSGAVWNETVAALVNIAGSFTNNATTFTASTGVHTFSGIGKTFSGTTATVIPSVSLTGDYTNDGTLTVATLLTIATGHTLTNNSTVTATASLAGAGTFDNAGTLTIGNGITITTLTATTVGNTVIYNRANTQTGKVTTYYNLTLGGSNAKTFSTTPTVNGTLSMEGTATVVVTTGVVTYGSSATLQYNRGATAQTVTSEEWITPFAATGGVVIKGTGAQSLDTAKVFNAGAALNITSGATLTPGANLLTFNGDFINAGTLTSGSGGVTITGTAASQSIAGFTTTGTVTFSKTAGTATLGGAVNGGAFTLGGSGGTLDMGSGLVHTFSGVFTSTNGTINLNNSTLNINNTTVWSAGTWNTGTGKINYGRAGDQTIFPITYYDLTLSGSGIKTTSGATVDNILSMEGTATTAGTAPTYGAGATLQYKGSAQQSTGIEFPATFSGSGGVIINNASNVVLSGSVAITNTLTLTAGALSIGANTLTLDGDISQTSGTLTGGATSNIIFGGSGAATTLPAVTLNNLTINRANGINMGGPVTVGGTLTLTSGAFTVGANTLTLNGPTIAGTPTNLSAGTTSNISIGGSSVGVTLPSSVTALHNLTINNVNGLTLGAGVTLSGTLTETSGKLNITVTAVTDTKVYNGTTSSSGSPTITVGALIVGHSVTWTQVFSDKNVGTGKTLTPSGSGTDYAKYNATFVTDTTGVITAKALTVTGMSATTKAYDGGTTVTLTGGSLVGVASGDTVSISTRAGAFADKNVGTGKPVTVTSVTLTGTDAGNYTVTNPTDVTGTITAKALTVTGMLATSREYDGGTTVTLTGGSLVGVISPDDVSINTRTGSFATKTVGTAKPVTVTSVTLTGADAGNYTVTNPTGITADITAKALTVTGMLATTKVYDGGTTVALTGGSLVGVIGGDTVSIATRTGAFSDKNVGTSKAVTVTSVTLTGTDAGNYTVTNPTDVTGTITAKALTITGMTAVSREYDGGTTVSLSGGTLVGIISPDIVSFTGSTGSFSTKTVGTGKPITVTGTTLTGTDAGNYTVTDPTDVTGTITAKALTVTGMTATSKVYDGGTTVTLTGGTLVGLIVGDNVSINTRTGSFATKSVGTGKAVTVTSVTLTGADAGNYTVTNPTDVTGDITAKALTVTGMLATTKVYDGGTTVTLTGGSLVGVIAGDTVSISSGSGDFSDKNVGTGKAVTVTSVTLTGADAGNYTVTNPTDVTGTITAKALTITGMTATSREYDGGTTVALTGGSLVGVISPDDVSFTGSSGSVATKTVGTGKAVTVTGTTLTGTDAGNYSITNPTGITADITAKALTVTGMLATTKAYDGGTSVTLTGGTLVGVIAGDIVSINTRSGSFADENVGTAKPVIVTSVTLTGADAGNYIVTSPTDVTGDITAKALTITGMTANNKEYDGTTDVILAGGTLVGVVSGDIVSINTRTGAFSDKNVGTGKSVTVTSVTLTGSSAGNYTATNPTGITANITAKALTVTGMLATSKVYDGGTTVTLTDGSLVGVIGTDTVSINTRTGSFVDMNVGTGKAVTVTSVTLTGTDAGNYTVTNPTDVTGDITARALTVTGMTATTKEYDGTTDAILTGGTLVGILAGDTVSVDTGTGTFADKNVGTGKPVTVTSVTLTGADAGNYTVTNPTDVTGDITAKALTITGMTATSREYDGGTTVTLSGGSLVGVINPDVVSFTGSSGSVASKTVGTGKTVTVTGTTLTGADAGNYTVTNPTGITVDITTKALTVTGITASDKVYDGTTTATLNVGGASLVGIIGADSVTLNTVSAVGNFDTADVGVNKTVNITGLSITGTDAVNYSLTQPTATASILSAIYQFSLSHPGTLVAGERVPYTVTQQDNHGDPVTSGSSTIYLYSSSGDANKKFYDAATGGNVITSVRIENGFSSVNFWYYDELAGSVTITASDHSGTPDGNTGLIDGTDSLTVTSAAVSKFLLNNVTTVAAGERAAYTVTRKDQFNNLVSTGTNAVYLYSSSSGANKKFYDAATGGNVVTSINIIAGESAANFWYYDELAGTFNITASDSAIAPDALGIEDATDSIIVSSGAVYTFVLNNPGDMSAGDRKDYTVTRRDQYGNLATASDTIVYLYSSSNGANKKFYDAAIGGTVITSIHITTGNSAADFWYYDEAPGTYTITASDNLNAPDGSNGIIDGTDPIVVSSGALATFTINDVISMIAGERAAYTVTRNDQFGNAITSGPTLVYLYSSAGGNNRFYDAPSGGNPISSVTIADGASTANFWYYNELAGLATVTASDNATAADGATGIADASDSLTVDPASVSQFILNNPGNMTVKTRLGYTVTRKDAFNNLVTTGVNTVYLYTNSTGPSFFYDAATNGTAISSVTIAAGSSAASFWYYDEAAGTWNITASDNSIAPDGSTGIADAVDPITVDSAAVVATKFVILDPGNGTVEAPVTVTVQAQDDNGNIDVTFQTGVTLRADGSALGGGLVSITNGVGTIDISDTVAETVHLHLSDTQITNLDVSSSRSIVFAPGAVSKLTLSDAPDISAGNRSTYTVTRKDRFNNLVSTGTTLVYLYTNATGGLGKFYDAPTNGHIITDVSILPNNATASFWYYEEKAGSWTVTVSDNASSPDGSTGLEDASDNIAITPASTARFILNNPGDMSTKTRLGYTVSREDLYGNVVSTGSDTVYLYSSSNGVFSFYNAASGGITISSIAIGSGVSSANFWYYEEKAGTWDITASDNPSSPDGSTGIIDGTDPVIVSENPITATKIVILAPATVTVGNPATVTINAQDNSGNIDTTYNNQVTLVVGGSATGGGLVNIVNGIGTKLVNDNSAETIQISLLDTLSTGLDTSSVQFLTFQQLPSSGVTTNPPLSANTFRLTGAAFPDSVVFLEQKTGTGEIFNNRQVNVAPDGTFVYASSGFQPSVYTFNLMVKDKDGRETQTKVFNADFIRNQNVATHVVISPTIDLLRFMVTRGDFIKAFGYATANNLIRIEVDGGINYETRADATGAYQILINTAGMTPSLHTIRARQQNAVTKRFGEYSILINFIVTGLAVPQSDLNGDGKLTIADWSIFLEWWRTTDSRADLNKDGQVNISDLSVFLRGFKK